MTQRSWWHGGPLAGEKHGRHQQRGETGGTTGDDRPGLRKQRAQGWRQSGTTATRSGMAEHLCSLASRCDVPASNGGPGGETNTNEEARPNTKGRVGIELERLWGLLEPQI